MKVLYPSVGQSILRGDCITCSLSLCVCVCISMSFTAYSHFPSHISDYFLYDEALDNLQSAQDEFLIAKRLLRREREQKMARMEW